MQRSDFGPVSRNFGSNILFCGLSPVDVLYYLDFFFAISCSFTCSQSGLVFAAVVVICLPLLVCWFQFYHIASSPSVSYLDGIAVHSCVFQLEWNKKIKISLRCMFIAVCYDFQHKSRKPLIF